MMRMFFLFFTLVLGFHGQPQNPAVDSMKARLARAKTSSDKVDILGRLSRTLMSANIGESDRYANEMTREAEISRDRRLIIKALMTNGERHSYLSFKKEYIDKSLDYYNQALIMARKNDLDRETARAYLGIAAVYSKIPDPDKALNSTTQAFALISGMKDDTLTIAAYNSYGAVYLLKKERILALRNYLLALRVAEEAKKPIFLRSCYNNLSRFYADVKEYDRAIDYAQKALDELPRAQPENEKYQRVIDLFSIGTLYVAKKAYNMSVDYFERSIALADSLKYPQLKLPAYEGLLNQYVQADEPQKALDLLNSRQDLRDFGVRFGTGYMIDGTYGIIYNKLGRPDSARYYFARAEPQYERSGALNYRIGFYYQYADFFRRNGDNDKAIEYYMKAKSLAEQSDNLELQQMIVKELDTVYAKKGDYKNSYQFNSMYYVYKDSLNKLGEEKDLLQMELQDEQQRQERLAREEAEKLRQRHQIQYMGITIAIAVVFLLLVLLGIFQVSETTIKIMGFFAFILLFEFIILIADNKIHHWTHGEPLPILGIKIVLIAMLLPLHHYLEHRVVSYLASRRLIIPKRKGLLGNIWKRKGTTVEQE